MLDGSMYLQVWSFDNLSLVSISILMLIVFKLILVRELGNGHCWRLPMHKVPGTVCLGQPPQEVGHCSYHCVRMKIRQSSHKNEISRQPPDNN
jgi:hypothetical protein